VIDRLIADAGAVSAALDRIVRPAVARQGVRRPAGVAALGVGELTDLAPATVVGFGAQRPGLLATPHGPGAATPTATEEDA
jgi:hypothetical protein